MPTAEIHKGLTGVVVDSTAVSKVNPDTNSLLYRGYPVQQLAAACSFEQVVYLLWHGELPSDAQLADFTARERALRPLDDRVSAVLATLPLDAHPMDVVRTAVSVQGALDPDAWNEQPGAVLDKALSLLATLPTITAATQRRRAGLDPIPPRDDLGYAADFHWMTFGELPDEVVRKAFDVSMTLYAEHSFNASTFTARVVASTLSDYWSAVVAAIGALKGPLHGGANEAVMHVFEEIGTADRAADWLDESLAAKRKIMGFGHRVYKNGDSRVPTMKAALDTLADHFDRADVVAMYDALNDAMQARKAIQPNLDYPSGPAYHLMGYETEIFTPLFVAARIAGWTAHIQEQYAANALIRPLSAYVGVDERAVPGFPIS